MSLAFQRYGKFYPPKHVEQIGQRTERKTPSTFSDSVNIGKEAWHVPMED